MLEFVGREVIEIVALDDAGGIDGFDGEVGSEISDEMGGFAGEGRLFFDEKAVHDEWSGAQPSQRLEENKCLG